MAPAVSGTDCLCMLSALMSATSNRLAVTCLLTQPASHVLSDVGDSLYVQYVRWLWQC